MTDDIFGRIQKAATKISDSKNETSISDKIKAFNASVSEYNGYMDSLLDMIKSETENLSNIEKGHASKVAEMLDKYDQVFNSTRETIINNTLNIIPDSLSLLKNGDNPSYSETDYTAKTAEIAAKVKEKLQDYTNPEDTVNKNFSHLKITPNITKSDTIKNGYEISGKYIKIKKDANVKAVEFGFSIAQYNLSHFDIENDFETVGDKIGYYKGDVDNANVIHRFYRGLLFVTDIYDSEKTKIRAKIITPDTDFITDANRSIGPKIDFEFKQDNEYIYVKIAKFTPYRIDWDIQRDNEYTTISEPEYYDMLDETHINESKIFFEIYCFFDDITRKDEYEDREEFASENEYSKAENIDFNLSLSPSKGGFIKFINFQVPEVKGTEFDTKRFKFFSHKIDKYIGDETFNEFKKIDVEPVEGDVRSVAVFDNSLFFLTSKSVFVKRNNSKNTNNILGIEEEYSPFAIAKTGDRINDSLAILSSTHGIDIYSYGKFYAGVDESNELSRYLTKIIEAKAVPSIKCFIAYSEDGVFLYSYNNIGMYDIRFLYRISSSDKLEKNTKTRLFVNEKYAYFVADNRITKFDLSNLSDVKTIIVVDKILDNDKILSVFYNKKTEKSEVIYQNESTKEIKIILDIDSTPFTEKTLPSVYNEYELSIFNHTKTDNVLLTLSKEGETKLAFIDPSRIVDSSYEPKFTTFDSGDTEKQIFEEDPYTGNCVFYNGSIFVANGVSYMEDKTFESIRNTVLSTLKNESVLRASPNLLYKLEIFASDLKKNFGTNAVDSMSTEFGIFKNYEVEGFDFYNLRRVLFAVNKNNRTDVYISTSIPSEIENNLQDARKFKMNHVIVPMGIKDVVRENINSENEYFIGSDGELYQFGSYTISENKQVLVKPRKINNPDGFGTYKKITIYEDRIFATDGDKVCIINAKELDVEKNNTVILNISGDELVASAKGAILYSKNNEDVIQEIKFIKNDGTVSEISLSGTILSAIVKIIPTYKYFIFITLHKEIYYFESFGSTLNENLITTDDEILDIHPFVKEWYSTFLVEKENELYIRRISGENSLVDTNVSIEDNFIYSLVLKDSYEKVYNYGVSNGYHYGNRNCNIDEKGEIPLDSVQLGNDKILKTFVDENKTYLITESGKLWVSGGKNFKGEDMNPYLGFESPSHEAPFFEELYDIPFDPKEIKDIKFDTYVTFVLLNNGNLYACGSDIYGSMGIDSVKKDENYYVTQFNLITKKVDRIWTGFGRTIIEKTEKKKKVYYGSGSNEYGKLGALNNDEWRVWTKISNLSLDTESIKEIYCFKDNTFVLTNGGSLYTTGRNDNGQLGLDDNSNVFEFRKVPNVSKVQKIFTNETNTVVLILDSSGKAFYSGKTSNEILNSRTFEEFEIPSGNRVTNFMISKNDSEVLFFLETNEGERKICKFNSTGITESISIAIGNVIKVIPVTNGYYALTSEQKVYHLTFSGDILNVKNFFAPNSYEANGESLAFTKYNDIIKFTTIDSAIKFVDTDGIPGLIYTIGLLLKTNSLGIGVGKIEDSNSDYYLTKAYLGVSNFDESSEALNSGSIVEDMDNYKITPVNSGKIMDCENVMRDKMISVTLTIYPVNTNPSELECTISGNETNSGYGEFSATLK
ncbi:MAG: hypothetical protein IJ772_05155 [Bacilli bacterium]|nr:hypothetical protein [Bacilli bacterium]